MRKYLKNAALSYFQVSDLEFRPLSKTTNGAVQEILTILGTKKSQALGYISIITLTLIELFSTFSTFFFVITFL